jgi:hypothetical protein
MQNSWFTEEGRDGGSAAKIWTQSQNRGSTSDQMVTPSSAHPDEMKTPDPNLLVDIDFDPPCVVNGKREIGERRPRDTIKGFFYDGLSEFNAPLIIKISSLVKFHVANSHLHILAVFVS